MFSDLGNYEGIILSPLRISSPMLALHATAAIAGDRVAMIIAADNILW